MVVFFHFAVALAQLVKALSIHVPYTPPNSTQGTVSSLPDQFPNPQWKTVLGNALYYFDSQRSGNLNSGKYYNNRVKWRNHSALNDGEDIELDLSGGFYDAGDYIKCTFPLTFTLFALSWGALSYGPGIDAASQTVYYDANLRWGFDWLMKAHPTDDVLIVQVGDGEVDHNQWSRDNQIPLPRLSFMVNKTAPGTDVWASAAAAFALGSMAYGGDRWNTSADTYRPASIVDYRYSSELLGHAKALYETAKTVNPKAVYSDTLPKMAEAYGSSFYSDDFITAGLALAAATDEPMYYKEAYDCYTEFGLSGNESMWGWESRLPAAFVLFAEIAQARPTLAERAGLERNLTGWQAEAEFYFDNIVDGTLKNGSLTPGGLLSYGQLSNLNSLQPALAAAALLFRYAPLASDVERKAKYQAFAQTQVDYWLGKNPMNAVYMVGLHPNSPVQIHSAAATGGGDWDNIPEVPEHILYGGVMGGPRITDDKFYDLREDWQQSEATLDYTANAVAIAAYALTSSMPDPFYVSLTANFTPAAGEPCDDAMPCEGLKGGGSKEETLDSKDNASELRQDLLKTPPINVLVAEGVAGAGPPRTTISIPPKPTAAAPNDPKLASQVSPGSGDDP